MMKRICTYLLIEEWRHRQDFIGR